MTIDTVDLRLEAAAETERLTAARALLRDGDAQALRSLEGGAPWILMARRSHLRRALGGRPCTVWRVSLEDASGRTVESRLVAVLLEAQRDPPGSRRSWIRRLVSMVREDHALARSAVESACADWTAEATRVTQAFAATRLRRERDIAAGPPRADPLRQQGLFDRRAERARESCVAAIRTDEESAAERQAAIVSASTIAVRPAQLLLVLVP